MPFSCSQMPVSSKFHVSSTSSKERNFSYATLFRLAALVALFMWCELSITAQPTQVDQLLDFVRNRPVVAELIATRPSSPMHDAAIRAIREREPNIRFDSPKVLVFLVRWSPDGFTFRDLASIADADRPTTLTPTFYVGRLGVTNWNATIPHVLIAVGDDPAGKADVISHVDGAWFAPFNMAQQMNLFNCGPNFLILQSPRSRGFFRPLFEDTVWTVVTEKC